MRRGGGRVAAPQLGQRRSDVLRVLRGVFDLPQPRRPVAGVDMDHQIRAGVIALAVLARLARPRTDLDRHHVLLDEIANRLVPLGHRLNLLSQNALWTVSPSASVTTRSQRPVAATRRQCRIRPLGWISRRTGAAIAARISSAAIS